MNRKFQKRKRLLLFSFIFIPFLFFMARLEANLLPPLKEISHMQCKSITNMIIDEATAESIHLLDHSSLLLNQNESYTANTALINQFCSQLSSNITKKLQKLPEEKIEIPLGAVTSYSFFANKGPSLPFTLVPMGAVKVDYATAFTSVGINQINYKIWLDISLEMKIVNPLYQETLQMQRKIMLADLIFSGKVPEHYFQLSSSDEYLLTE